MGGGTTQTTQSQQKTKSNQKQKGQTGPWAPTQKPLYNLIQAAGQIPGATDTTVTPQQNWAISGLENNAQNAATNFNPQQEGLINSLYSGGDIGRGDQNLTNAGNTLNNYLQPGYLDPNTNPYLQPSLDALGNQVKNNVSNQFALAGRDFSGDFSGALGKGYANAMAPLLLGQYNQNVGAQQNAAQLMPENARAQDASALNRLNVQMQAPGQIGALNNPYLTQLATSQTAAGLPYTNLNAAQQFLLPIASLGGTSQSASKGNTTTTGTQTTTMAQDPMQTALGAGLGGLGLLGSMGAFGAGGLGGWLTPQLTAA